MDISFLPEWPPTWPTAVAVAVLALFAAAAGEVAARWVRVPRLLGYLAAGALFGAGGYVLQLLKIEELPIRTMQFSMNFAAAVILFDVGQRVSFGWVRRNPALLVASVLESGLTFVAVYLVMQALDDRTAGGGADRGDQHVDVASGRSRRHAGAARAGPGDRAHVVADGAEFDLRGGAVDAAARVGACPDPRRAGRLSTASGVLDRGSLALAAIGARVFLWVVGFVGRDRAAQIMVMLAVVWIVFASAVALKLSPLLTLLACGAFVRTFDQQRLLARTDIGLASGVALALFFALSAAVVDGRVLFAAWLPALALVVVRADLQDRRGQRTGSFHRNYVAQGNADRHRAVTDVGAGADAD